MNKMIPNFVYPIIHRMKSPIKSTKVLIGRYQRQKLVKQLSLRAVDLCGPLIGPDQRVLEILSECRIFGLETCLKKGAVVSGVAVSNETIDQAFNKLKRWHDSNSIFLYQSNLSELPFSSDWFDCTYHTDNFYYWDNLESISAELLRVLKPGGMHLCTLSIDLAKHDSHKGLLSKRGASGPLAYMMALERVGFEEISISYHDEKTIQCIQAVKPLDSVDEDTDSSEK